MSQFPCARCPTHLKIFIGGTVKCECGAQYTAMESQLRSSYGMAIMLGRELDDTARDQHCPYCGERAAFSLFPSFALFRTLTCDPDHWHVVEMTHQLCRTCNAVLQVEVSEALTPIWAEMVESA